ncbi:MAG: sulfatase-like hydrolase/transferase [Pirellulaceae bacterium]|nr:sulfatase-like hydrolase/transferase [Pirellulaceae bacterium]
MKTSTLLPFFLLMLFTVSPAAAAKTNIVYIMADELGYYETSYMGSTTIQTPRIDQLARQGIQFTQGLAGSAVCAPTRCCFLTGKHSGHTSVRVNGGGTPLRSEEVTIGTILKKEGYATGGFGKWGCGGRGSTGVPEKHGFDTFVGYYDQVHAHSYYPKYLIENSKELLLEGNEGGSTGTNYSHYVIVNRAKQFIRENKDKPFFCYLPITPPHGIFDIPDNDPAWKLYKDKPWSEPARRYAAMVSMVDRQVGEIVDLLKELKLDKNTIVFFSGDNGGNDYFTDKDHPRGFHGANVHPRTGVEFRGRKGNLYEGGLRIPALAYWPGKIKPGQVSDHLWYFPDVMPTIAELTGATPPGDIDGLSFVPELLGADAVGREQPRHKYLYWEIGSQTAVRMNQYKLYRGAPNRPWELYDLATDVSETRNLADARTEILEQMKKLAAEAHQPPVEGTFADTVNHEKDRQAKWGSTRPAGRPGQANRLDMKGVIAQKNYKLTRVSSESRGNQRLARHAFDGKPATHWHTSFTPKPDKHPHELVIDLGKEYTISGLHYLARQDGGWNGALKDCEIYVSKQADTFGDPVAKAVFRKSRRTQRVKFAKTSGRYLRLVITSDVNGGPWSSISELGVVGQ